MTLYPWMSLNLPKLTKWITYNADLRKQTNFSFFPPEGECVSVCPDGFYGDEDTNDCEECHSDCMTCNGPEDDDCLSCEEGRSQENGECVSDHEVCPIKTFRSGETNTYVFH